MPQRPTVDRTEAGEQYVLPGAERLTEREMLERKMRERIKARRPQKRADEGLFGRSSTAGKPT